VILVSHTILSCQRNAVIIIHMCSIALYSCFMKKVCRRRNSSFTQKYLSLDVGGHPNLKSNAQCSPSESLRPGAVSEIRRERFETRGTLTLPQIIPPKKPALESNYHTVLRIAKGKQRAHTYRHRIMVKACDTEMVELTCRLTSWSWALLEKPDTQELPSILWN
jgi:hypothetical protein